MPRKLPLPCTAPGCVGFRRAPQRFCRLHEADATSYRFKRNLEAAAQDSRAESNKFYKTKGWKQTRLWVLNNEPLCRSCQQPATMVDHIKPIHEGGDTTALENLQPLCDSCHASKRGQEGARVLKSRRGGSRSP